MIKIEEIEISDKILREGEITDEEEYRKEKR
jgi:hypothetical protein